MQARPSRTNLYNGSTVGDDYVVFSLDRGSDKRDVREVDLMIDDALNVRGKVGWEP